MLQLKLDGWDGLEDAGFTIVLGSVDRVSMAFDKVKQSRWEQDHLASA